VYARLLPLALATFAVGTDGFVIAGLLPVIAADLDVDIPTAGQLVTAFAVAFALSSPVLGAMTSSLDRRSALLIALSIFVVGNVVTAVGSTYAVVLTARVITAIGAGIINSSASSAATAIAPADRRGRALSFVMGGLILATAVGLPLGTLIGRDDWHVTLWGVAGLGLLAAVGVAVGLPRISLPRAALRARLTPLTDHRVVSVLVVTMTALAGTYTLYTYIGSALMPATEGSETTLTGILFVWGIGSLLGNILAGRLVDRYPAERVLTGGLFVATLVLAVSPLVLGSLGATIGWACVWGACVGFPVVPQQHRLVRHTPGSAQILLGLNSSAIYAGIALGGALGGVAQHAFAARWLGIPAACATALALIVTLITVRRRVRDTAEAVASA